MPEQPVWSEDVCTCGHPASLHADNTGTCGQCVSNASYAPRGRKPNVCARYQWNGVERRRIW